VKDIRIDEVLEQATRASDQVPPDLVDRIAGSIASTLAPVRPLPAPWLLAAGVTLIGVAVALLGALRAGFQGFEALGGSARLVIFGTLAALLIIAARQVVAAWIPGSRRSLSPAAVLLLSSSALLVMFAALFHDYHVQQFVSAGLTCLLTGVLHAIPAGLLGWWLLRRGYAVNDISAGLLAGIFGGLVGVTLLELHCPNFEAAHLLLWHTLVVPVSGAIGLLTGLLLRDRSVRQKLPGRSA
jgi:hypothetical protein